MNLPATATSLNPANFDPTKPETYNSATSVTIYDSLGQSHIASTYYIKAEDASYSGTNTWVSFLTVDGKPVNAWDAVGGTSVAGTYNFDADGDGVADDDGGTPATLLTRNATYTDAAGGSYTGVVLSFDSVGKHTGSSPAILSFQPLGIDGADVLAPGADKDQTFTLNYKDPTQFAAGFEVTALEQNGLTVGRLSGIEIGGDGLITGTYSNGTELPIARVALVRFKNEQGLIQSGSNWEETLNSGEAKAGEATSGSFGDIRSAALEQSNVNLTTELVDLITAQRNFQANSRALEINNTLQQTILQIR
jgi:flagellar hook protein FlgE